MLDNDNAPADQQTQSSEVPVANPPRRRRAARRPAGAPAEIRPNDANIITDTTAVAEAQPPLVEQEPIAPAEPVEEPAQAGASDGAEQPEPLTPKRRRAATRPAGQPPAARRRVVPVEEVAAAVEAPVAETVQVEDEVSEVAEPEAQVAEPAEKKKPARRRATRKAAPSEAVVSEQGVIVAAAQAEVPAEPEVTVEASEPGKPAQEAAATAPEADPAPVQPRNRRRRVTRPVAAAKTETEDDDAIGAALRAAEDLAEARKAVLADPFMTADARQAQLDALAGAIAAATDANAEVEEQAQADPDAGSEEPEEAPGEPLETEGDQRAEDSEEEADGDDDRPSRRRRRRGGRRRRRPEGRDADQENDDEEPEEQERGSDDNGDDSATEAGDEGNGSQDGGSEDGETDGEDGGTTRRRRRRRRRGDSDKDGHTDEVTGIEGSTRMEAKRQRRKESRAAGRRRAPILSEAEFLARRESVDRKLIIRQSAEYTQLAVIEDDILVEHYVDKASATSLIGNIYVGRVQNVLPSMEAAFIDIGRGRNAVLYAGEVDWSAFGVNGENRKIENVLKSGSSILVQVTKDPVGAKGARLTAHISLPGRYVVYSPGGHLSGISRKLSDVERHRLRNVLGHLISDEESVIVRTAAEGANEDELVRDVNRLKAQWEVIEKKSKAGGAPQALYAEPDLTLRIVRDLFTEDFGALIVQGRGDQDDAFDAISAYVGHIAPNLVERLQRFEVQDGGKDIFAKYKIDEQIAKALDRKVYLPSGGSLVIDRTEAMIVIDVNTGRFTGSGGNLEATVTSNNLEAAEEIVRQLRLRDLGGIIVIDFIDMVLPSNRDLLLRRLVECLGRDRTRHQVAEVTSLGLVQLTRKRIGTGLAEAFTEPCEHCHGAGYVRFEEPVDSQAPADGGERKGSSRRHRK